MTGNVWEWCANFKPSSHVFWGGYWLYSANSLRVAGRHYYFPAGPYGNSLCVRIPCCAAVGLPLSMCSMVLTALPLVGHSSRLKGSFQS